MELLAQNRLVVALREFSSVDLLLFRLELRLAEKQHLLSRATERWLEPGEALAEAGGVPALISLVEEGRLEVDGGEFLAHGACVGCLETLAMVPTSRAVRAAERSLVWQLAPALVEHWMQSERTYDRLRDLFAASLAGTAPRFAGEMGRAAAAVRPHQLRRANLLGEAELLMLRANPWVERVRSTALEAGVHPQAAVWTDGDRLLYRFTLHRYAEGELIARAGEAAAVRVVENGTATVLADSGLETSEHYSVGHGEEFGALEALYRVPMTRDVYAREEAWVWRADAELLEQYMSDPRVFRGLESLFLGTVLRKVPRRPVLLIPGFASTQLMAWRAKECSGRDVSVGQRVWIDLEEILEDALFGSDCWLSCMALGDIVRQTDPPDCKLRPNEGLHAIYELAPGAVTGPITTIYRALVNMLTESYAYDVNSLIAVPYDFRLPPDVLESRDSFFSKLKARIESVVRSNNNQPAVVVAHSMGNNVLIHFDRWLARRSSPGEHRAWFRRHVGTYIAAGAPLLGATETIRGLVTGLNMGLPVSEARARRMTITFGSMFWMLPVAVRNATRARWPRDMVSVQLDSSRAGTAAPGAGPVRHFSVEDVTRGVLLEAFSDFINNDTEPWSVDRVRHGHPGGPRGAGACDKGDKKKARDTQFDEMVVSLQRHYTNNPVDNPLAPEGPSRPPVDDVLLVYGVNLETDIKYRFRQVPQPQFVRGVVSPMTTELVEVVRERAGGRLVRRQVGGLAPDGEEPRRPWPRGGAVGADTDGASAGAGGDDDDGKDEGSNGYDRSGDGTVPYASLQFAHTWHTSDEVVVEEVAESEPTPHDGLLSSFFEGLFGPDTDWSAAAAARTPPHTRFRSQSREPDGRRFETTILEVDGQEHRDIIRDPSFSGIVRGHLFKHGRTRFLAPLAGWLREHGDETRFLWCDADEAASEAAGSCRAEVVGRVLRFCDQVEEGGASAGDDAARAACATQVGVRVRV